MASFGTAVGLVFIAVFLLLGIAQSLDLSPHLAGAATSDIPQVDQRDLNLCMNDCMRDCVTEPGTEGGCLAGCDVECGSNHIE